MRWRPRSRRRRLEPMCLAIPSKVVRVEGAEAVVERYGECLTVSLAMLPEPVGIGDYVIVQARRHAVQKLDAAAAEEAIRLFDELAELLGADIEAAPPGPEDRPA